jgi:hypothetical protein
MTATEVLGVDIGGVIIDRVSEDDEARRMAHLGYSGAAAIDGALEAIARLVRRRFHDRVWLVSRCDEPRERVLSEWLERQNFFGATGVPRAQVRFCRERHEKAIICKELGITHFIDDRLEVLSHLVGAVPHLYLFQSRADDVDAFRRFLPHVRPMSRWSDIVEALLAN